MTNNVNLRSGLPSIRESNPRLFKDDSKASTELPLDDPWLYLMEERNV